MNDFQMTLLANNRIDEYRAEAQRQRLARPDREASAGRRDPRATGARRFGLPLMFGRSGA